MASYLSTNYASLQAQSALSSTQSGLNKSIQRLSTGSRINSAADDAAGLAITDRMTAQINGVNKAVNNANDAISLSQTADSALGSIGNNLQGLRQLAVQAANSTNSASDLTSLNEQAQQLIGDISSIGSTTQFNGINLLDGSLSHAAFQVGANAGQTLGMSLAAATVDSLGSYGGQGTFVSQTPFSASNAIAINGVKIGASSASDNGYYGVTANSAAARAAAINAQSASTGVTASAVTVGSGSAPIGNPAPAPAFPLIISAGMLTLNGVQLGSISGSDAISSGQSFAAAVNAVSAQTGVTANADPNSGAITLTAQDGRDIIVGDNSTLQTGGFGAGPQYNKDALASLGFTPDVWYWYGTHIGAVNPFAGYVNSSGTLQPANDSRTFTGKLKLTSAAPFSLTNVGAQASALADAGIDPNATDSPSSWTTYNTVGIPPTGTTAYTEKIETVGRINLSTQAGATSALRVLDAAINQVDTERGVLGAEQNRLTQSMSNLQQSSINLSASRSRIRDTDFAAETANLSQAQILQQAGTAMLTQANSMLNSVLSLLKNA